MANRSRDPRQTTATRGGAVGRVGIGRLTAMVVALVTALAGGSQFWRADDRPPEGPAIEAPAGILTDDVALASLPPQARRTWDLIHAGGPFPFTQDGSVFANRERHLPPAKRGHYREYTVPTPGAGNRGARRIVCGGQPPERPDVCWFTVDHYNTFRQIRP